MNAKVIQLRKQAYEAAGLDVKAIDLAQEQVINWRQTGCTPSECLQTLGILGDVLPEQRDWMVVFLATYEAAQRFA